MMQSIRKVHFLLLHFQQKKYCLPESLLLFIPIHQQLSQRMIPLNAKHRSRHLRKLLHQQFDLRKFYPRRFRLRIHQNSQVLDLPNLEQVKSRQDQLFPRLLIPLSYHPPKLLFHLPLIPRNHLLLPALNPPHRLLHYGPPRLLPASHQLHRLLH